MLIFTADAMLLHHPGPGHPERPDRLRAVVAALADLALDTRAPNPASRDAVIRAHSAAHVSDIESRRGQTSIIDADTVLSDGSVDAAFLAAGAAVAAVDAVMTGESQQAFALVRPPGHHAESTHGMGFCLFNNVAVAAEHALAQHGCERVLILDWDAHHGNGTQHSFAGRSDVMFVSLHQYPFYPGTGAVAEHGEGAGAHHTVNVAMPEGAADADYLAAFDDVVVPIADAYAPDLILVSAGYDAHVADPLAGLRVTEDGFGMMSAKVADLAARHTGGKLVLLLEGGYDLEALGRSVRTTVDVLLGATAPTVARATSPAVGRVLRDATALHRTRWPV